MFDLLLLKGVVSDTTDSRTEGADLYVTLELLGLSAVALAALAGSTAAVQAALRYLLVGLLGSMLFLAGVSLIYAGYGTLDLAALAQLVEAGPAVWPALTLPRSDSCPMSPA